MNDPESLKRNWTSWFEIPVSDLNRARLFYENIFETKIQILDLGQLQMGIFPYLETGCALCLHNQYVPSPNGVLVYLNASPDLNHVLERIPVFGGKILQDKKQISPEMGYMALFLDTENNRLALHSLS